MRRVLLVAAVAAGCASSSGNERPSSEDCRRLRDHVVALRLSEVHVATGVDRERHRQALERALGDRFVATCSSSSTVAAVECALDATDAAQAARCKP